MEATVTPLLDLDALARFMAEFAPQYHQEKGACTMKISTRRMPDGDFAADVTDADGCICYTHCAPTKREAVSGAVQFIREAREWSQESKPTISIDGEPVSLAEFLEANECDDDVCEWARFAQVGDEYRTGGAQAEIICRRIS